MARSFRRRHYDPFLWKPVGISGTYFERFMNLIKAKYNVKLDDYWDLHKWSIENIPEFWGELWDFAEIKCSKKFDQVIDLSIPMSDCPKWFRGARLNIAENYLKHRNSKIALIAVGETRERRIITFAEMYEETKLYAAAFRKLGLKKEDKVVCYLSNREEAMFAMLATASIGAIWVGALPMLGAQAVLDRVKQVNPSFLIAGDRICYNGQEMDMLSNVKTFSKSLPTLQKVVIVPTLPNSLEKDISDVPNSCFLSEFLDLGRNPDGSVPDIIFEQLPFTQPYVIEYTSGTTGLPKAIVHDYGCLLTAARDQILFAEPNSNDVFLSVAPAGWATWNLVPMMCFGGRSSVLYDGSPFTLTPTYFWDLIDEYRISVIFITPGILDDLENKGYVPTKTHKLTSLTTLIAGGNVVKLQNYDFVYQNIKSNIMFFSAYGLTEVIGGLMSTHYSLPISKAGQITCPNLGTDIQTLDEEGEPVIGKVGDVVLAKPLPSLLLGIYGDKDGSVLKEKYFSRHSNKFETGDMAIINPFSGGIFFYGRSDEVLKQLGCRFESMDIYSVVNWLPEIQDSLCVSQYSKSMDERAVLFLKMNKGYELDDKLVKKVKDTIENKCSEGHVPGLIMEVPEMPYNINGKKMDLLVKKIINGQPYNPDLIINKDCLKYFKKVPPHVD